MSKFPEPDFSNPPLAAPPPGTDVEDLDLAEALRQNANGTNEGHSKLGVLLQYLTGFQEYRITEAEEGVVHTILSKIEGTGEPSSLSPFKLSVRTSPDTGIIEYIVGQGHNTDTHHIHTVIDDTNGSSITISQLDTWQPYTGTRYIVLEGGVEEDLSLTDNVLTVKDVGEDETQEIQLNDDGYQDKVRLLIGVVYEDIAANAQRRQAVFTPQVLTRGFYNGTICRIFNAHPASLIIA